MTHLLPEEILRRIKDEADRSRKTMASKDWKPVTRQDLESWQQILCFDQALSNCGWALLNTDPEVAVADAPAWPSVHESGTIRVSSMGTKGFEATFTKAIVLAREIRKVLLDMEGRFTNGVVLELPSVIGYRTESSLVAAVTICVTLDELGYDFPRFISRTSAAATLCGDRSASKKVSSDLVEQLVADRPGGTGQWTEHVRDAVFVGLKAVHRG